MLLRIKPVTQNTVSQRNPYMYYNIIIHDTRLELCLNINNKFYGVGISGSVVKEIFVRDYFKQSQEDLFLFEEQLK